MSDTTSMSDLGGIGASGASTDAESGASAAVQASLPGSDANTERTGETAIEAAFRAAEASLAQSSSASDGAGTEQAGSGASGSDSTPAESATAGAAGDVATGATSGDAAPAGPVSTAQAPINWPSERRDAFQALPPDAQSLVLDFHRDMQAGFTRATQDVAQIRQQADEYARLQREAKADPAGFARALLASLNLEPTALAADEPPEFSTPGELAKWAADRAERAAERRLAAHRQEAERAGAMERARAALDAELADLAKIPGFDTVRDAALRQVAESGGALTLTDAVNLQRLPQLLDGQRELATLRAEVAALRKAESDRKKSLGAPVASTATRDQNGRYTHAPQSPTELAFERASAQLARQAA